MSMALTDEQLLDSREAMGEIDPAGMTGLIEDLPRQWREAEEIARAAQIQGVRDPKNIVILGMGGSAIGGDFVRSLLEPTVQIPIAVNRDYSLPAYVDRDSLVIASSYSGNTEETLTAAAEAQKRGAQVVAITTGGQLAGRAETNGWPLIRIPGGLSPRAAIGYSFVPLYVLMERIGIAPSVADDLAETAELLEKQRQRFGPDVPVSENLAKQLALSLKGKLPLVYGSYGWTGTAAYRWKTQINENSKAPAVNNTFPELNHNETVGWEVPEEVTKQIELVILRDRMDNDRVKARIEVTREIVEGRVSGVTELWSEGESEVARLFSLIYPGDFVSLYLALIYRVDPTPVKMIDLLKSRLAELS